MRVAADGNERGGVHGTSSCFHCDSVGHPWWPQACAIMLQEFGMDMFNPVGSPFVEDAKSLEALGRRDRELMPLSES